MPSHKKISPRVKRKVRLLKTAARGAAHFALLEKYKKRRRIFIVAQSIGFATVLLLSVILQTYLQIKPPTYALDATVKNLIGESRDDTMQYLSENQQTQSFDFLVPKSDDTEPKAHTGRIADAYSANLPKDAEDGVKFMDTTTNIDMTVTPQFKTYEAKKVDGDHIVYLASGGVKLVYTLKYNGLKEDIIVPSYRGDKLEYGFELSLPAGVEARLDEQGNIGIYSSDPTLFGNVSFGSDEDRTRVEKAREKGEKTNLVATIPSPIVKDATGKEYSDKSLFKLGEKVQKVTTNSINENLPAEVKEQLKNKSTRNSYALNISSYNLKDLAYPISIDPTFQTTSASDFAGLNHEGNTEIDTTNNLVRRADLTGGIVTTSTTTTNIGGVSRYCEGGIAYNGYMYITGGYSVTGQTSYNTSYYTPIDSDGNITTAYTQGPNLPSANQCHQMAARGGYIYIFGGYQGGALSVVWRSKIGQNGALGTWESLTGMGTGIYLGDAEIVSDFVYVTGSFGSVRYAQFLADGTFSAWATVTAGYPPTMGFGVQFASFNGVLYMSGGYPPGSGAANSQNTTFYARPSSNGDISSWTSGPNLNQARGSHTMEVLGGYLYVAGGCGSRDALGGCNTQINAIEYAQINADGTYGTWRFTGVGISTLWAASTVYNGIWYNLGGCTSASNALALSNGQCNAAGNQTLGTWRVLTKPAGEPHGFSNTNNVTTARVGHVVVAYNGYLYSIGGCTALGGTSGSYTNCTTATTSIEYGTINANGTVTWNGTTTGINAARWGFAAGAYNGFMYVTGGCEVGFLGACTRQSNSFWAPINTNGTIGAWTTDGDAFTARSYHGFAANDGYIYAAGGEEGSGVVSTVYKSQIQSNGSPGAWSTTTSMPVAGLNVTMQASGNYLYAVNPGANTDVVSAPFTTNGNIGSWTNVIDMTAAGQAELFIDRGVLYVYNSGGATSIQYGYLMGDGTITDATGGTSLLTTSTVVTSQPHDHSNAVAVHAGFMYVVSGCNSSTGNDCASAPVNTEHTLLNNGGQGNVSSWTQDGTTFGTARAGHNTIVLNGIMYIIGGFTSTILTTTTNIQYAAINADGSMGAFASTTTAAPTASARGAAYNGRLYLASDDDTYYITPQSGGNLTGSWTSGPAIPTQTTRTELLTTINNGIWYVVGGRNGATFFDDVNYSLIDPTTGVPGSWQIAAADIPIPLSAGELVGYGSYLFVIGGQIDSSDNMTAAVYSASIGGSGEPGAWTATSPLPSSSRYHSVVTLNGFMYSFANYNDPQESFFAPILSGGKLGVWQNFSPATTYGEERYYADSVVWNGRVYVTGGSTASNLAFHNSIERAPPSSIPRISSFSKRYDFGAGVKPTKLITRGTKRSGAVVSVNYANNVICGAAAFDQPQSITDTGYTGANAQTLTLGTSRTLAQCLFLRYTIDETRNAIFPDRGNETSITDFDLYFTANPGQRLRGGRTFTNGADRGLDAQ